MATFETTKKESLKEKITNYAKEIGFDLVGFSPAKIEEKYLKAFEDWLNNGHEGQMQYMQKIEKRRDLTKILPGAKSVIVLATNYFYQQNPLKKDHGRVACYAYGRDYHKIIGKKLKQLEKFIAEIEPTAQTKSYVDTGPILERALAEQAGIGRIGKNTCLITPQFGSWVFLSEILTSLDLIEEKNLHASAEKSIATNTTLANPAATSFRSRAFSICGNCTKCITACPTGAIIAPGVIDARLCISYLTIENKDKIPPKLAKIIKKQKLLYGCDICQEVCPHNEAKQRIHTHPDLQNPQIAGDQLNFKKIAKIKTAQQYLQTFAGSPLMRIKKEGLQRTTKALL